jgi:hypothetical protein
MKCTKCGKPIKHPYYINNQPYGVECYKEQMQFVYKELSDIRLEEHMKETIAVMETLKIKDLNKIKNAYKLNMLKTTLQVWEETHKLSKYQVENIKQTFNNDDFLHYLLSCVELGTCTYNYICHWLKDMCLNTNKKYTDIYNECLSKSI